MTFKIKTQVQAPNGLIFNISFKTRSADALRRYSEQLSNAGFRPIEQPAMGIKNSEIKPNSISPDNQGTSSRFNGSHSAPANPQKKINITKISVQAVQRGPNTGSPKWDIETDANINFCIFGLDEFIRGRYITRETAMSETWQKLGQEIIIDPPLPATIEKPDKWWQLNFVHPSQEHIDELYPPKIFVPTNVVEIVDIEMHHQKGMRNRVIWKGKTDDLDQEIIINQQHREHIHGIGIDTSTWDLPESYTKSVMLNVGKNNMPTQAMNRDGVWTESRHHKSLLNGETICRRNEDGEIYYMTISKIETRANNGPSTITFEGNHPQIEDTFDRFYVCLTPIPQAAKSEEIPF